MTLPAKSLTPFQRKARKLKRDPVQFISDSKVYVGARKTVYHTWAKLGSFMLVIVASLIVVAYFSVIASPRYVSKAQFVVKKAESSEPALSGLMGFGAGSPSTRDALLVKKYIHSRDMALALDEALDLKSHYVNGRWDFFSRLPPKSSVEDFLAYYQAYTQIHYDEISEVITVEAQAFTPEFSLKIANEILQLSENFINKLSEKMVKQQMAYGQQDVARAHEELKRQQQRLVNFQDEFKLYSPEQQSSALVGAVNSLEAEIIKEEADLKSLLAYMRGDSADVKTKENRIQALEQQLSQEKDRLTKEAPNSLNKINLSYQEIRLSNQLATDLYQSSLTSLELIRSDAFRTLTHLLVIETPSLAQENKYPRRLRSILTWFVSLLLAYAVIKVIVALIKEHK